MSLVNDTDGPEETLRDRFGLQRFRPGQREVIDQVLAGRDVLCVMPTGGGKSLCYQVPAVMLPGVALVVSPLIALMKDQVDALSQRGIQATLLNSTIDPAAQRQRMAEIEAGVYDLVYVAPERFRSSRFTTMMARVRPALLAIDEAHCISQWGHDFRPDYARLGEARRQLGSPPCIALTATATDNVRRDVAAQLNLRDPGVFVTGFDRPNLRYTVARTARDEAKLEELSRVLERNPGPSVVYASSRARCEMVAEFVARQLRRQVVVYHAGMEREARTNAQEAFMHGDADVVVATNAFGMGVDKADIRSVVHFNMPGTLEAYYQEAGRAGRDGLPSVCALLFSSGDRRLQEMFIDNEYPPAPAVHQVYEFLRRRDDDPIQLTHAEIREESGVGLNESAVGAILKILGDAGAIEKFAPRENMAIVRFNLDSDDDLDSLGDRLGPQAHVRRTVLTGLAALTRGRVGEACYFRPDEFAETLGLERPALGRAIRSLTSELPIDYIPPFRGVAIRVVDRERKPRDVAIDFARLEKRKRHEYDKLDRMTQYALSTICRRSLILSYFGERANISDRCDHCDNCKTDDGASSRTAATTIDTQETRETIQKVLSGVARARGRFGKTSVAQMLAGSDSERMSRGGLNQLSTFGILRHGGLTHKEIADVIEALTAIGLVESQEVDRFKPVVALSEAGWTWLRDREAPPLVLALPPDIARKFDRADASGSSAPSAGVEAAELVADPLLDRLRELRQQWARELKQPAYCIFSNQTLEALARQRPTSPADLAEIKGLGRARIERYGASILEAITGRPTTTAPSRPTPISAVPPRGPERREADSVLAPSPPSEPIRSTDARIREGEASAESAPAAAPSPSRTDSRKPTTTTSAHVSTEEWSWRLLDRGFTLEEASAIRGLDPAVVARHLIWMVRRGRPLAVERFLPPETIEAWDAWSASHPRREPPTEPAGAVALWPLFRVCRDER